MVTDGDTAPKFTLPLADGDITEFTLSERLESEAPIVLAFFPGAFTRVCTTELCTFQDRLGAFDAVGGTVYGVSIDSPFALNEFREREGLTFGLLSDTNKTVIDEYGVRMDFDDIGLYGVAKRAVFVIDSDRTVTYAWQHDDPSVEPDYDAVETAVRETG